MAYKKTKPEEKKKDYTVEPFVKDEEQKTPEKEQKEQQENIENKKEEPKVETKQPEKNLADEYLNMARVIQADFDNYRKRQNDVPYRQNRDHDRRKISDPLHSAAEKNDGKRGKDHPGHDFRNAEADPQRLSRRRALHRVSDGKRRKQNQPGKEQRKSAAPDALFHVVRRTAVTVFAVEHGGRYLCILDDHGKKRADPHPENRSRTAHRDRRRNSGDISHSQRTRKRDARRAERRYSVAPSAGKRFYRPYRVTERK